MSVYRISSNTISDNGVFHLKNREYSMDKVNAQINTGKKNRLPREDVVDVSQSMTFHSKISKINQYVKSIQDVEGERSLVEGKLMSTVDMLQKVRELAVQAANGVYDEEGRKAMAMEVDQLLRNVILDANSKYKDNFLFSGHKKYTKPFEILEGAVKGMNGEMITSVRYMGDNGKHLREVDAGEYVSSSKSGSDLYWAENFQIYSSVGTADFRITRDMSILVDGNRVDFNAGDNMYAIMDKINQSPAAVNASVDIVTGNFILKTTEPHKPELADIEGGNLLQTLGILEEGLPVGPDNYSSTATVFGGSIFDVMIGMRDAMITNNSEDIGGRYLGAIDGAIDNLMFHTAESGALTNKLTYLTQRHEDDKESYVTALSNLQDVDVAESVSELKLLEFAHKVALSSLARLSQTSLMDFIR